MRIRAVYENGVFKPLDTVLLKEGTEVEADPCSEGHKTPASRGKSARELGAYGMWADRIDIGAGIDYVNRIICGDGKTIRKDCRVTRD